LIKGIVGWVDLTDENIDGNIKRLKNDSNGKLVGLRHILDGEKSDWIVSDVVKRGLKVVFDNQLTFDLLLRPHILKHAVELAKEFPKMTFIIDHISKPRMNSNQFDTDWSNGLKEASKYKNIFCKL
jgi:L-fuconolactonase